MTKPSNQHHVKAPVWTGFFDVREDSEFLEEVIDLMNVAYNSTMMIAVEVLTG